MDKNILMIGGLVGAGLIAYMLFGRSTTGTTPIGGSGGTKKQGMDPTVTEFFEETTTTEGGLGLSGGGYTINLPPPQTITFPPLLDPRDWGYTPPPVSQTRTTKKASKTQTPTTWDEYTEQRGAGEIGTPSYTMTQQEVESELSHLTLGGFRA